MLRTSVAAAIAILMLSMSSACQAQDAEQPPQTSLLQSGYLGTGVNPGITAKDTLLEEPAIQEELKLTQAQKDRLKKTASQVERMLLARNRERTQILNELRAQGDRAAFEAKTEEFRNFAMRDFRMLARESDGPLLEVLNRRQRIRLEQIQLQADGFMAFRRPEIQERLNLLPDQIESIDEIINNSRQALKKAGEIPAGILPPRPNPRAFTATKGESGDFEGDL